MGSRYKHLIHVTTQAIKHTTKSSHQILPEDVNDLVHEEAKRQATISRENPLTFNIDKELQSINQLLVQFIDSIALSIHEYKHSSLGRMSDSSQHLKKVRTSNIITLPLYSTNPTQPLLIHDLIADTVEMCGGSRELLRILNKLDYSSSPDTHDCFVAQHANNERTLSIWNELSSNALQLSSNAFIQLLQLTTLICCKLFSCLLW